MSVNQFILIGAPGSGKTTVGRFLAKEIDEEFLDTDNLIELETGRTISEIFLEEGEAKFRIIEREIVLRTLREQAGVIALGGGSVLDPEVAGELRQRSNVIYLEVTITNAAPRVGFNKERPLLLGNPRQQWLKLMEHRKPIYESLGKFRVSTDNRKPKEVVAEILRWAA